MAEGGLGLPFYSPHPKARPAGQLKLFKPVCNRLVRGVFHGVVTFYFGEFILMKTAARRGLVTM